MSGSASVVGAHRAQRWAVLAALGLSAGCEQKPALKNQVQAVSSAAVSVAPTTSQQQRDCCMGKNACKGQGGCAVPESHACAGKNVCAGRGGCSARCPE